MPRISGITAEILRKGYGVHVEKALNPLQDADFILASERLKRSMAKSVRVEEEAALVGITKDLDINWATASEEENTRAIEKAKRRLTWLPAAVIAGITLTTGSQIWSVVKETRRRTVDQLGLGISSEIGVTDTQSASFVLESQGLHIVDEYQRRADALEKLVRGTLAAALGAGLSGGAIAGALAAVVSASQSARSGAYWDVSAMAAVNHARTATQINALSEAGIITYQFVAVVDDRTTDICLYMNGRTFSVDAALSQLRSVEQLTSSAEIKAARPWVAKGRGDDGEDILYFKRGQDRVIVAHMRPDGQFTGGLDSSQLEAAGLLVPPLHGWCRSKIVVS